MHTVAVNEPSTTQVPTIIIRAHHSDLHQLLHIFGWAVEKDIAQSTRSNLHLRVNCSVMHFGLCLTNSKPSSTGILKHQGDQYMLQALLKPIAKFRFLFGYLCICTHALQLSHKTQKARLQTENIHLSPSPSPSRVSILAEKKISGAWTTVFAFYHFPKQMPNKHHAYPYPMLAGIQTECYSIHI